MFHERNAEIGGNFEEGRDSQSGNLLLQNYVRLSRALGEMFAPILEVVVYDLRNPDRAVVGIANGHITGLKLGDSAPELERRRCFEKDVPDELVSYSAEGPRGQQLKSSSVAIRGAEGALVGSLALNFDVTYFSHLGQFVEQFISNEQNPYVDRDDVPGVGTPKEEIRSAIQEFLISRNLQASALSSADKKEIVKHLHALGHLNMRGAVTIIAKELRLTRPSIYHYLREAA